MTDDQYYTVSESSQSIFRDRGSKFIAHLYPISKKEEALEYVASLQKEHPKANHVCYAYRIGQSGEEYRINDDGEPSGSAGRPIYNELLSNEITHVLCAVVRYFGGTKLGVPGLINAYKQSAREAITVNQKKIVTLTSQLTLTYTQEDVGSIYKILKRLGINQISQAWADQPQLIIEVPMSTVSDAIIKITAFIHGYDPSTISEDFISDRIKIAISED